MPKGVVDSGETPWTAALRELREEAGVTPEEVRRVETAPGIRAGPMTAFVVTLPPSRMTGGASRGPQRPRRRSGCPRARCAGYISCDRCER